MEEKIRKLLPQLNEIEEILGQPDVLADKKRYRELTQRHSYLSEIRDAWDKLQAVRKELHDMRDLHDRETDPELLELLDDEIPKLEEMEGEFEKRLHVILVPPDPKDHKNTILELRAGTGGDEAALFVGDCVRMYRLFADKMRWKYELLSCTPSEIGGYKEYIMVVAGPNVYRFLRHEGGTHRVQRVPDTEAQGRVHTSAITVAALPEPDEETQIQIDEKDLKIDTYRASGAGGQHVNVTDSAIRITHLPSGIVVTCQEDRSQHKNRDKAMRYLKAKLAEVESQKRQAEIAGQRAMQVGTGDRSERIRTYNFPQNRITDHRINFTRYNLDRVMEGELEELTGSLVSFFYNHS